MALNRSNGKRTSLAQDVAFARATFLFLRQAAILRELGFQSPEITAAARLYERVQSGLASVGGDMGAYLFKYGHAVPVSYQGMKLEGVPDFVNEPPVDQFAYWLDPWRGNRQAPLAVRDTIALQARLQPVVNQWNAALGL